MKFCDQHWQALRSAVSLRGMDHLVARSGAQAVEDMKAQLEGSDTLANWDPLMASYWSISSKVLRAAGLAALAPEFCPLCAVQESYEYRQQHPEQFDKAQQHDAQAWIDGCTDAMLDYARENNLMPGVQ